MNYFETFEKLRNSLKKAKFEQADGHFAIQVGITDPEASGIFYIEDFGDRVLAEPYNYYDNDAEIVGSSDSLQMLFEGKLELKKALEDGVISASGNMEALDNFFKRMTKAPAKKTATKSTPKKTATKSTAKKTTTKKTEAKKVTEDAKKKDTKKETETIKEVVEKEVKPKK